MKYTLVFLVLLFISGCDEKKSSNEKDIKESVKTAWKELYENYESSNLKFIDYYQDDVIRMNTDGECQVGKDIFEESWKEYYEKNYIKVLDYGEPTILHSKEQTVTFNTYKEIFVDKETLDTTLVEGTWIAVWKKQADGNWKIRMTTWHN